MKKFLTIAAILMATVGCALAVPVAHAQTDPDRSYYGAIAVSLSTGRYGYSYDFSSYAEAESQAVTRCGEGDCVAKISWRDGCGALAVSDNYFSYGAAPTRAGARAKALAANPGNAHIEHWNCTSNYSL